MMPELPFPSDERRGFGESSSRHREGSQRAWQGHSRLIAVLTSLTLTVPLVDMRDRGDPHCMARNQAVDVQPSAGLLGRHSSHIHTKLMLLLQITCYCRLAYSALASFRMG